MSTKLEMPDNLPPLPPVPEGYDRWEYRGMGWKPQHFVCYGFLIASPESSNQWRSRGGSSLPDGSDDTHYIEAVKDKPEMVEFCGGNGKHTGMYDMVNNPPHYRQGSIETIDAIKAALTPEEFRGYLRGNCLKYLWRCNAKGGLEDLRKAEWYLKRIIGDEKA